MVLLSLCIPTNGVSEWVFPVLDAIYNQGVDEDIYEVVVTDNGNNDEFNKKMLDYVACHKNLVYQTNNSYMFQNQIEALKIASGEFLKFVNHRSVLKLGSLQWMIDIVRDTIADKPVIYMSNGALGLKKTIESDFDGFVMGLREYASWTTGVGVWREDFLKIPENHIYNKISPHSDVLFAEKKKSRYLIYDNVWSNEIVSEHSKKGQYDLYKAFACDELAITLDLYINGHISSDTFKAVKKAYFDCVCEFYCKFSLLKRPCSYDLSGFDDAMGVFFSKWKVMLRAYRIMIKHYVRI